MQEKHHLNPPFSNSGRMYEYRIKNIIRDDVTVKSPKDNIWVRRIGILFTGMEKNLYRFQVFCLKVEDRSASSPVYNIEKTKFYLFDDVRISVNPKGEIIKLNNLPAIQKRWKKERKELERFNKGDSVQNYFNSIDRLLNDKQGVINFLSDYALYGLLFNGTVFGNLSPDIENKRTVSPEFLFSTRIEECWKYLNAREPEEDIHFSVKGYARNPEKPQQEALLKKYEGVFVYNRHQLTDAVMETHYNNHFRKHTLLWIG